MVELDEVTPVHLTQPVRDEVLFWRFVGTSDSKVGVGCL